MALCVFLFSVRTDQLSCGPGLEEVPEANACVQCGLGSYSRGWNLECVPCPGAHTTTRQQESRV